jgi:hypothetical protein
MTQMQKSNDQPKIYCQGHKGYLAWVKALFLIAFGIVVVLIAKAIYDRQPSVIASREAKIQAELEQEFKAIAALPNSTLINYASSSSIGKYQFFSEDSVGPNASVRASYAAGSFMPTDVFDYYDKQLRAQGWEFTGNFSEYGGIRKASPTCGGIICRKSPRLSPVIKKTNILPLSNIIKKAQPVPGNILFLWAENE